MMYEIDWGLEPKPKKKQGKSKKYPEGYKVHHARLKAEKRLTKMAETAKRQASQHKLDVPAAARGKSQRHDNGIQSSSGFGMSDYSSFGAQWKRGHYLAEESWGGYGWGNQRDE